MSNLAYSDGIRYTSIGVGAASWVEISAPATANTKSGWVQLTGSLAVDIHGFWVRTYQVDHGQFIYDIGVGSPGAEIVLVPNVIAWAEVGGSWFCPISISAGTRIAVRAQCANVSEAMVVALYGLGASGKRNYGDYRCAQGGANTATTAGTTIDPGGSSGVKGPWTQLLSSVPFQTKYVVLNAIGNPADSQRNRSTLDLGVGAAAAEQALCADILYFAKDFLALTVLAHIGFETDIPAGTRISARSAASVAQTPARLIYGQVLVFG